jgi:hypothetical protein
MAKRAAKPAAAPAKPAAFDVIAAINFIKESGGLNVVKESLAHYEKAHELVNRLGGYEQAKQLIETLEGLS